MDAASLYDALKKHRPTGSSVVSALYNELSGEVGYNNCPTRDQFAGLVDVNCVARMADDELFRIPNFGRKSLAVLRAYVPPPSNANLEVVSIAIKWLANRKTIKNTEMEALCEFVLRDAN